MGADPELLHLLTEVTLLIAPARDHQAEALRVDAGIRQQQLEGVHQREDAFGFMKAADEHDDDVIVPQPHRRAKSAAFVGPWPEALGVHRIADDGDAALGDAFQHQGITGARAHGKEHVCGFIHHRFDLPDQRAVLAGEWNVFVRDDGHPEAAGPFGPRRLVGEEVAGIGGVNDVESLEGPAEAVHPLSCSDARTIKPNARRPSRPGRGSASRSATGRLRIGKTISL